MLLKIVEKRRRLDLYTDDFFLEGNLEYYKRNFAKQIRLRSIMTDNEMVVIQSDKPIFTCRENNCQQCFDTLAQFEEHKFKVHKYRCSICLRSFTSDRLLSIHLSETHDTYFKVLSKKKPSYECVVAGCLHLFWTGELRRQHLIEDHLFPASYDLPKHRNVIKDHTKAQEGVVEVMNQNIIDRNVEITHINGNNRRSRRAILKSEYATKNGTTTLVEDMTL